MHPKYERCLICVNDFCIHIKPRVLLSYAENYLLFNSSLIKVQDT